MRRRRPAVPAVPAHHRSAGPTPLRRVLVAALTALMVTGLIPALTAAPAAAGPAAAGVRTAAEQDLLWTAGNSVTAYTSAPATAVAGPATIIFENSQATGNTLAMSHTLTFDTTTPGYNHDVTVDILANPLDAQGGRWEVEADLTPGTYRFFCAIPGHGTMVGELVVSGGGGEDTTAPTVTAEVTGEQDADGAYIGSASVTLDAVDEGSGVASVEYDLDDAGYQAYDGPVVVDTVGTHTLTHRATDTAGNTSEPGTVTFTVTAPAEQDTTAPVVLPEVLGERDASGAYVASATVTLTAVDEGSGVASVEYDLDDAGYQAYAGPVVVDTVGSHTLTYRATDTAGNTSEPGSIGFDVVAAGPEDSAAPQVSATVVGTRDAAGHYTGRGTVSLVATDEGSGVASVEYRLDGGAWQVYTAPVVVVAPGSHTFLYRATDRAGNVSTPGSVTFTVAVMGADLCPSSDVRPTVIIGSHDSTVTNIDTGDGCTINDLVDEDGDHANHGQFLRHVRRMTAQLVDAGTISGSERSRIMKAAALSDVGR